MESDSEEFFVYEEVSCVQDALPVRGHFAKKLFSVASDEDEPVFCYEAPCWTYCLQYYSSLLSSRRVVESESILSDFRAALGREFKKLKWYASFKEDIGPHLIDLNETRHARAVFFKRVEREACSHPANRTLGCESSHDAFVATLELELAECVASWLSLKTRQGFGTSDEELKDKLSSFMLVMMGVSYHSFSSLRGEQRGSTNEPWPCSCMRDLWDTLRDLCCAAEVDKAGFTFHAVLERALKDFVNGGCPQLPFAAQGDLTFAWWFFGCIFGKDEVPSENVFDFLRRMTEKEKSEEALKLQLMHLFRCLRGAPSDEMIMSLFICVSACLKTEVTLGHSGDLRGYCTQPKRESASAWEDSARESAESVDIEGADDSFGIYLRILAKRRDSDVVLRNLKSLLKNIDYASLKEHSWVKMFDLFLTCAIVADNKMAVISEFLDATGNLSCVLSRPSSAWTVVVMGLWALMIAVWEDSAAIEKLAGILDLFLGRLLSSTDAGARETEKRVGFCALLEYYHGLSQFLSEAKQGPPSGLAYLLPPASPELVSKLSRLSGAKLLTSISTIVQAVRQAASNYSSKTYYNAQEQSFAEASLEWVGRILDRLWEPIKSLAIVDNGPMAVRCEPPSQISDILLEMTLMEKYKDQNKVFVGMMDATNPGDFQVHPLVLACYLQGIVSMEDKGQMDSDREMLFYGAWLRCRLLTPRLFWSRKVDDMLDKLDMTIMSLPLANRALEASMIGPCDDATLFSASRTVVEENRRTWKQLIERFNWLYTERQEEHEVSKLPRIFAHVPSYLKILGSNLDQYFKEGKRRDKVLQCAVEVATYVITKGSAVVWGKDGKGFKVIHQITSFIFLTPSARSVTTPLQKDLLDIASQYLSEVIMSFCETLPKNPSFKQLEKLTEILFKSYVTRYPVDDRHPVYKALMGFVGVLPSKIFFAAIKPDLNTNEKSIQVETTLNFLSFYLRRRRFGNYVDLAVEEFLIDVLGKGWNEPHNVNSRVYKDLLDVMMEYGSLQILRERMRKFIDRNRLMSAVKMRSIFALIKAKRPEMSDDAFTAFLAKFLDERKIQVNPRVV